MICRVYCTWNTLANKVCSSFNTSCSSQSAVSQKTLKRRSQEIAEIHTIVSGSCASDQLQSEIKSHPKVEREQMLKSISKIKIEVNPEHGLAMKADLGIPWNKLRTMRRHLISIFAFPKTK